VFTRTVWFGAGLTVGAVGAVAGIVRLRSTARRYLPEALQERALEAARRAGDEARSLGDESLAWVDERRRVVGERRRTRSEVEALLWSELRGAGL